MASFLWRLRRLDRHQRARRSLAPLLRPIAGEWSVPGALSGMPVVPTARRSSRHGSVSSGMSPASVTIVPNTAAYWHHSSLLPLPYSLIPIRISSTPLVVSPPQPRLVTALFFPKSVPSGLGTATGRPTSNVNVQDLCTRHCLTPTQQSRTK